MTGSAVTLSAKQSMIVLSAIVSDIDLLRINACALAVCPEYVHLLAEFGELSIRQTVGRLKSMATRALAERAEAFQSPRVWTKACHMKSIPSDRARGMAYKYVVQHARTGLIHDWISQADGSAVADGDIDIP